MCGQKELAPSTGTEHLQMVIHFKSNKRLAFFKKWNKNLAVTKGDGKLRAMSEYCMKEDTRAPGSLPWESGTLPEAGGDRKSL